MNPRLRLVLRWLALALRLYLGAVFLTACWYKILSPAEFALSIATYDIVPTWLVHPMALVLPWIELLSALTLITGFWTRASALAMVGMMVMFLAALGIALARDLQMSCGCFASAEAGNDINTTTLIRDSAWLLGAGFVLIVDDGLWGVDGWLRRRRARAARS